MFKQWLQDSTSTKYLPLNQTERPAASYRDFEAWAPMRSHEASGSREYIPMSSGSPAACDQPDFQPARRTHRLFQPLSVVLCTGILSFAIYLLLIGSGFADYLFGSKATRVPGAGLPAAELRRALVQQSNSVLLIKTGATVAAQRLPAHFRNELSTSTIPYQVYSDATQKVQGHLIIDVLADIASSDFIQQDEKFEPYRQQQAALKAGKSAEAGGAFWDIDVYKNIPMALDSVQRFPDADWYIFADADTYVVQSNLLKYLKALNPRIQHYLGATALINDVAFGHGGSGYVLSHALAHKAFVEERETMRQSAIERPGQECCGDFLLGDALYQIEGVDLTEPAQNSTLSFTGQLPEGIRYEEKRLCMPVFSMHHVVDPRKASQLWHFEQELLSKVGSEQMITFSHLFQHFAHPSLIQSITYGHDPELIIAGWDNFSDEHQVEEGEAEHFAACSAICEDHDECIGWHFSSEGKCTWQPNMRIGQEAKSVGSLSGWRVDRFRDLWNNRACF